MKKEVISMAKKVAILGLALAARKKAEKEVGKVLKAHGLSKVKIKLAAKRVAGVALREGKRAEKAVMNQIKKEVKSAKPGLKKGIKKNVGKVKKKAGKLMKKIRRR